jgi:hypothetical protein
VSGKCLQEDFVRRFFIGIGIVAAVFALAMQPSAAQSQRAVIGDDDLPNGAPAQSVAARVKAVCMKLPFHTSPQCLYDTLAECRAACRHKSSEVVRQGRGPAGARGRMRGTCFVNSAMPPRVRPLALTITPIAPGLCAQREHS